MSEKSFKQSQIFSNHRKYRKILNSRAKARRTIKTAKRVSWQRFVSSINSRTLRKKVCNIINKMSGKRSCTEIKHLQVNNKDVTSVADIADALADSFSEISTTSCSKKFLVRKNNIGQYPVKFNSNNTEVYNVPFSLEELLESLGKLSDTAVGPDDIHYGPFQSMSHLI